MVGLLSSPQSRTTRRRAHHNLAVAALGATLALGGVVVAPATAHAVVPEARTPLTGMIGAPGTPALAKGLALAPDRVVGMDSRDTTKSTYTAWTRTVSAAGFGPETVLQQTDGHILASAGRTDIGGTGTSSLYDRGVLTRTVTTGGWPVELSGPYLAVQILMGEGYQFGTLMLDVNGKVIGRYQGLGKLFGPRFLYYTTSYYGPRTYRLADVAAGTDVAFSVPDGCLIQSLWNDTATFSCTTGTVTIDIVTGVVTPVTPGGGLGAADGCVLGPVGDGLGHQVCATGTELVWRDYSSPATAAGRVLGWLATPSFSPGTSWTPEVDVSKPFAAGQLVIRRGSTVVRTLTVPASADGSLRNVTWDGTDGSGTSMIGYFTAELQVSGTDGTGPVKAVDGVSAPTFQVSRLLPGGFVPVTPARLLDTRSTRPVGGLSTIGLTVTGVGGVPDSGVGAVLLNVTAVEPPSHGYLTVFPTGVSAPVASNVNFMPGEVVPNLVLAKVGTGGQVTIYNGSTYGLDVVVDVEGYFLDGAVTDPGGVVPVTPARLIDTRLSEGGYGPVGAYGTTAVQVSGRFGVPAGASAAVINLTAVDATAPGYLTAFPTSAYPPTASNVNFLPGQTKANFAIVKLDSNGWFSVKNGAGGPTEIVADIAGYVVGGAATQAGMYVPLDPARILDTRAFGAAGPVAAYGVKALTVTGSQGVPGPAAVSAVLMNVTVVAGGAPGYLTAYPGDAARPLASNLNFDPYQTVPNAVGIKTSGGGVVSIYNGSDAPVDMVVDIGGYFRA